LCGGGENERIVVAVLAVAGAVAVVVK